MADRCVLITGGAGFIGAALAEHLLGLGESVVIFDVGDPWRLEHIVRKEGLHIVVGDVLNQDLVEEWVQKADFVYHLASEVGVDRYLAAPERVLQISFEGSKTVLDACLAHQVPVFLASTSEVYGNSLLPLQEDQPVMIGAPSGPRWSYAIGKLAAESYALALARRGLRVVVGRFFNVIGPKMARPGQGRVVSRLLGPLLRGEPLPLVDGGRAVRSFCDIRDVTAALTTIQQALFSESSPVVGQVVNIGREQPVSIRELGEMLADLAGVERHFVNTTGDRVFGTGFEEILYRVPDTSKARQLLGFSANTSLEESLEDILKHWGVAVRPSPAPKPPLLQMVRPLISPTMDTYQSFAASFRSGWLSNNGPVSRAFEAELASFLSVEDTVSLSTGADAIVLSLMLLRAKPGKAILPAFTYIATLNAVQVTGLEPVFCDIDPQTWTLSIEHLQKLLEEHDDVRAILPVNVYGVPPNLSQLVEISEKMNIPLVYDNCHGMGSTRQQVYLDARPQFQTLSLHATKVLPAVEGGVFYSQDAFIREEVRRLRTHGLGRDHLDATPGYNAKLDELRAAVGRQSLRELPDILQRRRDYGDRLRHFVERECGGAILLQHIPDDVRTNYQNFGVFLEAAPRYGIDKLIETFRYYGVEARRYFWPPLHELRQFPSKPTLPHTDWLSSGLVCLPLHSRMSEAALQQVENACLRVVERFPL